MGAGAPRSRPSRCAARFAARGVASGCGSQEETEADRGAAAACGALRRRLLLAVEKAASVLLARQSAHINPAEDAVSVADNNVIGSVAEESGQESQEKCDGAPPT